MAMPPVHERRSRKDRIQTARYQQRAWSQRRRKLVPAKVKPSSGETALVWYLRLTEPTTASSHSHNGWDNNRVAP